MFQAGANVMQQHMYDRIQTPGGEASASATLLVQRPITPEEKAMEVKCGVEEDAERLACSYLLDLEYQLAQSYYWSGIFLKDMFFFFCNWHPFLGMFFSHPRHPWAKSERVMTTIVSCSLTMLPSALLVQWGKQNEYQMLTGLAVFLFITLPVMIVEVALYWLAVGDIFCKNWSSCVCCVGCLKKSCFCMSFFFSFVMLGLSYLMLGDADAWELVHPFVLSRVQGYATWFPIFFIVPCIGFLPVWLQEKGAVQRGLGGPSPP